MVLIEGMIICKTKKDLDQILDRKKTIGFVPTMGALHEGHISLINNSLQENAQTVCSIFVNPTQFNNTQDFEKYPSTIEQDQQMLIKAGCTILFLPSVQEMYPHGLQSQSFDFGLVATVMEGKFRPGHFDGVGTIVSKLFDFVEPTKAYFGEKDYQQLCIIRRLVVIQKRNIQIIPCATLRESDGLAMSSRNMRLSPEQRVNAVFIYKTLQEAKQKYYSTTILQLKEWVKQQFEQNTYFELEYFEITDSVYLQPLDESSKNESPRAFIVARMGDVRLIDNMALKLIAVVYT